MISIIVGDLVVICLAIGIVLSVYTFIKIIISMLTK